MIRRRASLVLRYLILSDLHSNLHALVAALTAAGGLYDQIVCCGDLVGYGAHPNETVQWATKHLRRIVRGNHDKVAVGIDLPEGYNEVAKASLGWTGRILTAENRRYLEGLPRGPVAHDGFWLMHGSPIDEDLYLVSEGDARGMNRYLPGEINFFGHTHRQGGFAYFGDSLRMLAQTGQGALTHTLQLEPGMQYLINPGSTGQPRDGDARAAFCILDREANQVSFYRTEYDIEGAARSIVNAGLPELLAKRLFLGK